MDLTLPLTASYTDLCGCLYDLCHRSHGFSSLVCAGQAPCLRIALLLGPPSTLTGMYVGLNVGDETKGIHNFFLESLNKF